MNLFVATDKQRRLRLSADIIELFELTESSRVVLGFDASAQAIAIKRATNDADPTAATVDKRGYISAGPFYRRTRIEASGLRYVYAAEQDGWLVFVAEGIE